MENSTRWLTTVLSRSAREWKKFPHLSCWIRIGETADGPPDIQGDVRLVTAWDPFSERRETARMRMLAVIDGQLDAIEQTVRSAGAEPVPLKREVGHFAWLIRFVVKRETPEAIARTPGQETTSIAVKKAIRELADLLPLPLRPWPAVGKRGRPKKPPSRIPKRNSK